MSAHRILATLIACIAPASACSIANRIDTCDSPPGRDFQVNSLTNGDQYAVPARSLVRLPSGLYVGSFISEENPNDPTAPSELRAALFQSDGTIVAACNTAAGDVKISVATDEIVVRPVVAVGPTAASPVYFAWRAAPTGANAGQPAPIRVRLMTQDLCSWDQRAAPQQQIFTVTDPGEDGTSPALAVRPDGLEALVAWDSLPVNLGDPWRLRSRPVGVSNLSAGQVEPNGCNGLDSACTHSAEAFASSPVLTAFGTGYAMAWQELRTDGAAGWLVRVLTLDGFAAPLASGTNTHWFGDVTSVELAIAATDSQILVASAGNPQDILPLPDDDDVFVEWFDAAGNEVRPAVRVNEDRPGVQSRPALATLPGGAAIVVWRSADSGGSASTVRGRILGPTGTPLFCGLACDDGEFALSSSNGTRRSNPSVVTFGRQVVVLFSDATPGPHATDRLGYSVQARSFDLGPLVPELP